MANTGKRKIEELKHWEYAGLNRLKDYYQSTHFADVKERIGRAEANINILNSKIKNVRFYEIVKHRDLGNCVSHYLIDTNSVDTLRKLHEFIHTSEDFNADCETCLKRVCDEVDCGVCDYYSLVSSIHTFDCEMTTMAAILSSVEAECETKQFVFKVIAQDDQGCEFTYTIFVDFDFVERIEVAYQPGSIESKIAEIRNFFRNATKIKLENVVMKSNFRILDVDVEMKMKQSNPLELFNAVHCYSQLSNKYGQMGGFSYNNVVDWNGWLEVYCMLRQTTHWPVKSHSFGLKIATLLNEYQSYDWDKLSISFDVVSDKGELT